MRKYQKQPTAFFCVRPRLLRFLDDAGALYMEIHNPYSNEYRAWLIELTPEIAEIIVDWYKDNAPYSNIPRAVIEYRRAVWKDKNKKH